MNYISICFEVANDWIGLPLYFVGRSVGWYKKKTNLDNKKSYMNSRKVSKIPYSTDCMSRYDNISFLILYI